MFVYSEAMATAATANPMTDLLDAAATIFRDVRNRYRAHQATAEDIRAVHVAINAVLTVADALEARSGASLSREHVSILNDVRRVIRRYELFYWQTAPVFLRSR